MAKEEKKALFKEQKETLKSAQTAFSKFGKFELQGRKHIQKAIIHCYELYLEYEEEFIKTQCKEQGIKFKAKKPVKMVLMLAMQVSDKCDKRTKARIRTYVRVLKRFEELDYVIEDAAENLEAYGIDYFANPRKDKQNNNDDSDFDIKVSDDSDDFDEDEDDDSDNSKNDELDDLRDSDDEEDEDNANSDDDEDSEDDDDDTKSGAKPLSVPSKGAKSASPKGNDKPLSERFVNYFKQNGIKDENFVIWVKDGKVQKSNDNKLLLKLKAYNFTDL